MPRQIRPESEERTTKDRKGYCFFHPQRRERKGRNLPQRRVLKRLNGRKDRAFRSRNDGNPKTQGSTKVTKRIRKTKTVIGRDHNLPSVTAKKVLINYVDVKTKVSRLKQTHQRKRRSQDLLFCRNSGSINQINFRFKQAENIFKSSDKV